MAGLYPNPLAFLDRNYDASIILLGLCSAYSLAGCLMEHFVTFYSWTLISDLPFTTPASAPTPLQQVQSATGIRLMILYVIPKIFTTIITVYIAWGPRAEWWLKWCCAFLAVSWVSSFTVQIPLQLQVQRTGDRVALRRLVRTSWVRVLAMVGHCAFVFWFCLSLFGFDTREWQ